MKTLGQTTEGPITAPPTHAAGARVVRPHAVQRIQQAAGNFAVARLLQAKLEVGSPQDPAEREADRLADAVVSGPAAKRCACGGSDGEECEACRAGRGVVQRSIESAPAAPAPAPLVVHAALAAGGGRPLSSGVMGMMSSRLGHDFSGVRVHTDALAAESARAIGRGRTQSGTAWCSAPATTPPRAPRGGGSWRTSLCT